MERYSDITIGRFKSNNTNGNENSKTPQGYRNTIYPIISPASSDVFIITDFGDRLDTLAQQFYSDSTLYWIIASANPNSITFDSLGIPPGTQLRIPLNSSAIVTEFRRLNNGSSTVSFSVSSGGGGGGAGGSY
tara:strand:- start:288 stop:686 length:399 start_codon:yes stop_codon:yes gene_type:complete